jgi:hypothetical protein
VREVSMSGAILDVKSALGRVEEEIEQRVKVAQQRYALLEQRAEKAEARVEELEASVATEQRRHQATLENLDALSKLLGHEGEPLMYAAEKVAKELKEAKARVQSLEATVAKHELENDDNWLRRAEELEQVVKSLEAQLEESKKRPNYSVEELFAMYLPAAVAYLANQDPGLKGVAFRDAAQVLVSHLVSMHQERFPAPSRAPSGRCQSTSKILGDVAQCHLTHGHSGAHKAGLFRWGLEANELAGNRSPTYQSPSHRCLFDTGSITGQCLHDAGHPGPHVGGGTVVDKRWETP